MHSLEYSKIYNLSPLDHTLLSTFTFNVVEMSKFSKNFPASSQWKVQFSDDSRIRWSSNIFRRIYESRSDQDALKKIRTHPLRLCKRLSIDLRNKKKDSLVRSAPDDSDS